MTRKKLTLCCSVRRFNADRHSNLLTACDSWGGQRSKLNDTSWPHPVRRLRGERALEALLAEPADGGWRTVRKAGIHLDNADYIAGELGPLVSERV